MEPDNRKPVDEVEEKQAVTWEEFHKIIMEFIDFNKESEKVKNLKEWRVR